MTTFWATMLLQTYILHENLFFLNFAKYGPDLEVFRGCIESRINSSGSTTLKKRSIKVRIRLEEKHSRSSNCLLDVKYKLPLQKFGESTVLFLRIYFDTEF
jgi:hypothetical protein